MRLILSLLCILSTILSVSLACDECQKCGDHEEYITFSSNVIIEFDEDDLEIDDSFRKGGCLCLDGFVRNSAGFCVFYEDEILSDNEDDEEDEDDDDEDDDEEDDDDDDEDDDEEDDDEDDDDDDEVDDDEDGDANGDEDDDEDDDEDQDDDDDDDDEDDDDEGEDGDENGDEDGDEDDDEDDDDEDDENIEELKDHVSRTSESNQMDSVEATGNCDTCGNNDIEDENNGGEVFGDDEDKKDNYFCPRRYFRDGDSCVRYTSKKYDHGRCLTKHTKKLRKPKGYWKHRLQTHENEL